MVRAFPVIFGVTLIELLVVLALIAILAAVAVPLFSAQRLEWRLRAQAGQLISAIWVARSTALKTRHPVMLCPAHGKSCTGTYTAGFAVYGSAGELVRLFPPRPGVHVYGRSGGSEVSLPLSWGADGLANRNLTFLFCTEGTDANWSVVLNRVGRPRLVRNWGICPG